MMEFELVKILRLIGLTVPHLQWKHKQHPIMEFLTGSEGRMYRPAEEWQTYASYADYLLRVCTIVS